MTKSPISSSLWGKPEAVVLFAGLDHSGKTNALKKLTVQSGDPAVVSSRNNTATGANHAASRAIGFTVASLSLSSINLTIWDISTTTKHLWRHYFHGARAVVFFIDSTAQMEELIIASLMLEDIMRSEDLRDATLLILASKQDQPNARLPCELIEILKLYKYQSHKRAVNMMGIGGGLDSDLDNQLVEDTSTSTSLLQPPRTQLSSPTVATATATAAAKAPTEHYRTTEDDEELVLHGAMLWIETQLKGAACSGRQQSRFSSPRSQKEGVKALNSCSGPTSTSPVTSVVILDNSRNNAVVSAPSVSMPIAGPVPAPAHQGAVTPTSATFQSISCVSLPLISSPTPQPAAIAVAAAPIAPSTGTTSRRLENIHSSKSSALTSHQVVAQPPPPPPPQSDDEFLQSFYRSTDKSSSSEGNHNNRPYDRIERVDAGNNTLRSWGHETKLRLIYAVLTHNDDAVRHPAETVFEAMQIVEKDHFHLTEAYFWLQLVTYHIAVMKQTLRAIKGGAPAFAVAKPSFDFFQRQENSSELLNVNLIFTYYSREVVYNDDTARIQFVPPDRKALPSTLVAAVQR